MSSSSQSGQTDGGKISEFRTFFLDEGEDDPDSSSSVSGLFLFFDELEDWLLFEEFVVVFPPDLDPSERSCPAFLAFSPRSAVLISGFTLVRSVSISLSSLVGSGGNSQSEASNEQRREQSVM